MYAIDRQLPRLATDIGSRAAACCVEVKDAYVARTRCSGETSQLSAVRRRRASYVSRSFEALIWELWRAVRVRSVQPSPTAGQDAVYRSAGLLPSALRPSLCRLLRPPGSCYGVAPLAALVARAGAEADPAAADVAESGGAGGSATDPVS